MTASGTLDGWTRLDARTLAVDAAYVAGPLVPVAALALVFGRRLPGEGTTAVAVVAGLAVGTLLFRLLRFSTSRYRVHHDVVELRRGLVYRTRRTVPRDRVRSVDLTASPVQRLLGVTGVTVGTGRSVAGTEPAPLRLECVSHARGERLRRTLLADAAAPVRAPCGNLARLEWRWARYAPLSVSGVAAVWVLCGVAVRALDLAGIDVVDVAAVRAVLSSLGSAPAVLTVVAAVFVVGAVGSVALFAEAWWSYRLTREPDRSLVTTRGLLTRRTVSLEQGRLRGVELREPLTLRWAGAAGVRAVATGLSRTVGATAVGPATLLPPAPLATASRVADDVLGAEHAVVSATPLRPHPAAARRRRLMRAAVVGVAAACAVPGLGEGTPGQWVAAGAVAVVAVALAVDAHRSLGHALDGRHLVVRSGTLVRRTVALDRAALIGWRICRSPAQRAAGLCTLVATTSAGTGHLSVHDVDEAEGIAFAQDAVPGLVDPFLVGAHTSATGRDRAHD